MTDLGISSMGNSTRPQQKLRVVKELEGRSTTVVDELGRPKVSVLRHRDGSRLISDYTTNRNYHVETKDGVYIKSIVDPHDWFTRVDLKIKDTIEGKKTVVKIDAPKIDVFKNSSRLEKLIAKYLVKYVKDDHFHITQNIEFPDFKFLRHSDEKSRIREGTEFFNFAVDEYIPNKFNLFKNGLCINGKYMESSRGRSNYAMMPGYSHYDKEIRRGKTLICQDFYGKDKPALTHVAKNGRFAKEIIHDKKNSCTINDLIRNFSQHFHRSEGLYERGIIDSQGNNVKLSFRDTPNGKAPLIEVRHQSAKPRTLLEKLKGKPKETVWSSFTDNLGKVLEGEHSDKDVIKEGVKAFNKYVKQFLKVAK